MGKQAVPWQIQGFSWECTILVNNAGKNAKNGGWLWMHIKKDHALFWHILAGTFVHTTKFNNYFGAFSLKKSKLDWKQRTNL